MRKPAVIVGLILVPLLTASGVVMHLTNSSTGAGGHSDLPSDMSDSVSVNTTPQHNQTLRESSSSSDSESAAPTFSTPSNSEGSSDANSSNEPTPQSESSDTETEDAPSAPMFAETTADHPSTQWIATLANESSFRGSSRPDYGAASSPNAGEAIATSSAGVKNIPVDSLPAEETSDAFVAETSDSVSDDEVVQPPFPSQTQLESSEVLKDVPALVHDQTPTSPNVLESTFPKDTGQAPVQVPEPSSLVLLGLGLIGLAFASRKRK